MKPEACGTAAIISPIGKIVDQKTAKVYEYTKDVAGPISTKLYETLRGIQEGVLPDTHNWNHIIE